MAEVVKKTLKTAVKLKDKIRCAVISDTLMKKGTFENLGEGDILFHCGDFTKAGSMYELKKFNDILKDVPYKHKVIIGGNNDYQ